MEKIPNETPEKRPDKRKISPHSLEYAEKREDLQVINHALRRPACFSSDLLKEHKKARALWEVTENPDKYPKLVIDDTERKIKEQGLDAEYIQQRAKHSQRFFSMRYLYTGAHDACKEFLEEIMEEPRFQESIERIVLIFDTFVQDKRATKAPKVEKLLQGIKNKQIDAGTWLEMVEFHADRFLEKERLFKEKLESAFSEHFSEQVAELMEEGYFPSSRDDIEDIIETTSVRLEDGIENVMVERLGAYSPSENLVLLTARKDMTGPGLFHVYAHEMFHALSGATPLSRWNEVTEETKIEDSSRVGLRFGQSLTWLNEAVTEQLAIKVADNTLPTYAHERALLNYIIEESDLTFKDFTRAYFEHYEPEDRQEPAGPIPHWKTLHERLNGHFGPRFLSTVNKMVEQEGAEIALQKLKAQREA